ncbi:MAG: ribosome maturation factor RimM [Bacteroidales bacterium]
MNYAGFIEIGYIQRTHGIKGEVQAILDDSLNVNLQELESVFVEIDGIPIPFFITSTKQKNDDKTIIKFDDIDDLHSADELVGHKLTLPSDQIEEDDDLQLKDLIGYTIISANNQVVGIIKRYEEFNLNSIYYVETPKGEIIIPAVEDLIIEVDVDEKTVLMEIPEGLLDIYSEG